MRLLQTKRSFRKEFKRQIRMALVAAIGFTIAFAWKEAIYDTFNNYVARFLEVSPDHYLTHNYTAAVITIFGVLVILVTSKILRD